MRDCIEKLWETWHYKCLHHGSYFILWKIFPTISVRDWKGRFQVYFLLVKSEPQQCVKEKFEDIGTILKSTFYFFFVYLFLEMLLDWLLIASCIYSSSLRFPSLLWARDMESILKYFKTCDSWYKGLPTKKMWNDFRSNFTSFLWFLGVPKRIAVCDNRINVLQFATIFYWTRRLRSKNLCLFNPIAHSSGNKTPNKNTGLIWLVKNLGVGKRTRDEGLCHRIKLKNEHTLEALENIAHWLLLQKLFAIVSL